MSSLVIVGIVAVVLVLIIVAIYNGLVKARVRVKEAWSDITVQLKRRYDLIPNLVNTVEGYKVHEKDVLEGVTKARASAMNAQTVTDAAKAENVFEQALKSLFAVAESYPDLKANQNFLELQQELVDTEDKIQAARRFYNGAVRDLNTKIQTVPTNIIAGMFGFKNEPFFELDDAQTAAVAEPVKVDFSGDKK